MSYVNELLNKNYASNVVIFALGQYFCIRQPDSGLTVPAEYRGLVSGLTVNPSSVDLLRVNTTIASYSFNILDKDLIFTELYAAQTILATNTQVEIWVGRSNVSMSFSDYFKLPTTRIRSIGYSDSLYKVTTLEETSKMSNPIFTIKDKLTSDIDASVTTIPLLNYSVGFPASGLVKIDDELITYSSFDSGANTLLGCTRGTNNSVAVEHTSGSDVFNVVSVSDNPVDLILQLLISNGGGGSYDVLADGLGIDPDLIDITAIENIRDLNFQTDEFSFYMFGIDNALEFIQDELLLALNLRFVTSAESKISLALLDQTIFGSTTVSIDEDSTISVPQWNIDDTKCINKVILTWDWDEGSGVYRRISTYTDDDSISEIGVKPSLTRAFKGIKESLDGQAFVDLSASRILQRFSTPNPYIDFSTHIDKSLSNVGDKITLTSSRLPAGDGSLEFQNELEIISRAIDHSTGVVQFKTAYTSYTGIRQGYIAPSDVMISNTSQKSFTVNSGKGAGYMVGWVMRLWNNSTLEYETDPVNTIATIVGDVITMVDNFATTLIPNTHVIRFCDYDDATDSQKRYAFISAPGGADFDDGKPTYRITF